MKKIIFGKKVEFISNDVKVNENLHNRFNDYEDCYDEFDIQIFINDEKNNDEDFMSINPKIHITHSDGFTADFGNVIARWKFNNEKIIIYVKTKSPGNSPLNHLRKFRTMEYSIDAVEVIDQILYEYILVPTMFFFKDRAIIHSSGFVYKNKTFLLGGTGGTGKTSASLSVSKTNNASFLNDDISIIDEFGTIYPNLAYPKIYAYNTVGDLKLEKEILKNKTIFNKIQWNLKKRKNIQAVRRKISPKNLYGSVITDKSSLDYYLILFKEDVTEMKLTEMDTDKAIQATIEIIKSEYSSVFYPHLYWDNFNRRMLNKDSLTYLDTEQISDNWKTILTKSFQRGKIYKLSIPMTISNKEYKEQILTILDDLV